jgi:hypothetical protein
MPIREASRLPRGCQAQQREARRGMALAFPLECVFAQQRDMNPPYSTIKATLNGSHGGIQRRFAQRFGPHGGAKRNNEKRGGGWL